MKPNLFDYATSELSQDAFLCWLLKWGESSFHSVDEELNRIAIEFIDEIFSLHGYKRDDEIKQVRIIRQFKGLDVLAIIDEKYAILIEDKTFTSEHSGQLERYLEEVKTNISTRDLIPLPTYYKIIEQSNHQAIHKAGYQPFTRDRMIKILESHRRNLPMNTIIDDYLHHLKRLDDDINSYQTLPIAEWTAFSWQGFYRDLQKRLNGKWGYVSNPSGGFWGFWWKGNEQQYHYWQLEETVLRAKIEAKENPDIKAYRDMCMSTLMKDSSECDLKLKRPKRISTGKNMTIAYRENYLQLQENGLLDFEKTVFELERYGQYKQSVKSDDV
ncbi:PD-(D/E)XK nuclease family protein [Exiguobacterium sp. K1]|uniref:PD-(D/E)XK nuclease family protein n=1 Tax=Exiguobacterium sp. K1 TaxID=2980105 RepID=UPI00299E1087|nr:PD-(D/E)XK nuclease family protein [Exiguobacterium sp. K1]MDX1260119.1 PD-(D/E)XK nuclease family protein [Exiguobacterium sp. K1]